MWMSSRRTGLSTALLLFYLSLAMDHVPASEGPPPVLNPKTYKSPSGDYSLRVDPSDMYGRNHAGYQLTKSGREVWSAKFPFTMWDAGVTDAGVVGGYAYTHGWRGFGKDGIDEGMGDFHVVVIDAKGRVRLNEISKRQSSRFLHTPPNPLANGLIVDEANDRMVVRVSDADINRAVESWWVYRLSTATASDKLKPAQRMENSKNCSVIDAQPVPGTPLTLVHWWVYDRGDLGARFTLIDLKAKPVWSLELKKDYTIPGNDEAQSKLMRAIREQGAILRSDQDRHFDLHFVAKSQRVRFSVKTAAATSWTVSEVSRARYTIPTDEIESPLIPERPLKSLGKLVLQTRKQAPSPIRNVMDFVVDGSARIAFLRRDDNGPASFVLADQNGKTLREIRLDVDDDRESHWTSYAWVGGNRFILTRSAFGVDGKARAWSVDVETAEIVPLPGFDCPSVDRLAGFPDGSFVALATTRSRFTQETTVFGFDARGKRTWVLKQDYGKDPGTLFSPKDVAVTSTGRVVVLDVIRHTIQVFDRAGKYLKVIDLHKAWGRKPNYPSGISADRDGGFLVEDFNGSPPFVRMKPDGSVRMGFRPKHADGRAFVAREMRATAAGRLWTCDGHALLRLKDSGVVDRVLGPSPTSDHIGKVAAVTIDRRGQIYAVDSRTGAVHVFDSGGKFLHVCKTEPTDFSSELWDPAITATDEGHVYLSLGDVVSGRQGEYLHFSANGKRLGIERRKTDRWYVQPTTGNGLLLDYEQAHLVNSTGQTIRSITRRPDGNWLERPHRASVAADGSFAVVAQNSDRPGVTVNIYEPNGDPIRTVAMPTSVGPFPSIAYDRRGLVASGEGGLVVFDSAGAPIQSFSPSDRRDANADWHLFFVRGTNELLVFDGKSTTLLRYARP